MGGVGTDEFEVFVSGLTAEAREGMGDRLEELRSREEKT